MKNKKPFNLLKKLNLNDNILDQKMPTYYNGCGCLGAHIAHTFLKERTYPYGKNYLFKKLEDIGWSNDDILYTMAYCGTNLYSFSCAAWRLPVKDVIKNLLKIEKPITKAKFKSLYNSRGYDKDGYDVYGYDKKGFDRDGYDDSLCLIDD